MKLQIIERRFEEIKDTLKKSRKESEFFTKHLNSKDSKSENFIKNTIARMVTEKDMGIIDWENPRRIEDEFILFVISPVICIAQEIAENRRILSGESKNVVERKHIDYIIDKHGRIELSYKDKKDIIADIIYNFSLGSGVIAPLRKINEVGYIDNFIYLMIGEESIQLKFLKFTSKLHYVNNAINKSGISLKEPFISTNDSSKNRITAVGYEPANGHIYFNQRKFKDIQINSMADILKLNTVDKDIAEMLSLIMKNKETFIVSGANTGLGKTSLLRAMIGEIPDSVPIGVIDSSDELNVQELNKNKNIITLISSSLYSFRDLFDKMLKQSRKSLIVGEIVTPDQVDALIDSWLRLSCGGGGTFHSIRGEEVVNNLLNKALALPQYNGSEDRASADIARALSYVIHLDRSETDRKRVVVKTIHRVDVVDMSFLSSGKSSRVELVTKALRKYLYTKKYSLTELTRFSGEDDQWVKGKEFYREMEKLTDKNNIRESSWT